MIATALIRPLQATATQAPHITLYLDGQPLRVPANANLAAALMTHGLRTFRHNPAGGAPRAPYCMMGACFECLVEVDGIPNTQSCLTRVRDGMQVRTTAWSADATPDAPIGLSQGIGLTGIVE